MLEDVLKDKKYDELLEVYNKQTKMLNTIMKQSDKQTRQLIDLNEQLNEAANTDPMTGAYNRRYFFDISKKIISLTRREKKSLTVAMLDIDKFKLVNDTYGHDIGDVIIIDLTKQLDNTIRESDVFARFGGEEFVVIFQSTDEEGAMRVCEKIRTTVQASVPVDNIEYTVSIGVSKFLDSDKNIDDAIKRADTALYEAKETGRNKVVLG